MSEAGPRVTAQREGCCSSNSVGKPIKGVEIAIVNEDGTPATDGERGIVHVNSPSRFTGYISGQTKYKSLYKDWLNTGDVGYIDSNGELYIVDRIDDVIILDAHKIYSGEIEKSILELTEISECTVVKVECKNNEFVVCLYVGAVNSGAEDKRRIEKQAADIRNPTALHSM